MVKLFRISTIPISMNVLLKDQLKYLSEFYEVTAISGAGEDLEEIQLREGVKIKAIHIERKISIFRDIIALTQLYFYFRKEQPQIIHSITPKAGLLSMLAGKIAGVPVRMHTFTGLIFPYRNGALQKILIGADKLLCYTATHIYPEGEGVKNDLLKYNITKKPLKIIGNGNVNGLDLKHFSTNAVSEIQKNNLRKQLGISKKDFLFVFVGRMVHDKGINELVAAFKKLCLLHSNIKLLLVGNFEHDLDPLKTETLNEIGRNPRIIAAGFQKDVRPYFAISQALVFPSHREGFPNVVLQALAMEIPAIVTNISGCNEIVQNGRNGIIIPVKDRMQLKMAMTKFFTEKDTYNSLKEQARSSVLKYDREMIWQELKMEYEKHIKRK